MFAMAAALLHYLFSWLQLKHQLALEVLALRHQITVLNRQHPKPKLRPADRLIWITLKNFWPGWKSALVIFRPETVIDWHRAGFRIFWRWKSRARIGRPAKDRELIQLNAFPDDTAPKYLLRDRDSIYGSVFVQRVEGMGIKQKLIAPRSPWQNPYAERLIGSIRRECFDHVIVLKEWQLRQILTSYFEYYHEVRPHRSLEHDSPLPRPLQSPERGKVIERPLVGGLHHHCLRQAA